MTKPFRTIALLGREPGVLVLEEALLDNPAVDLVAVYTHGSLPKAEGGEPRPELARYLSTCQSRGVPLHVLDFPDARHLEDHLPNKSFDLLVVLSWRFILSKAVLDRPCVGAINMHRGVLPVYKGAEPVRRAIEAGDTSVSITSHRMTEELDEGEIVATVNMAFPPRPKDVSAEDYAETVKSSLYPLYAPLVRLSIVSIASSTKNRNMSGGPLSN